MCVFLYLFSFGRNFYIILSVSDVCFYVHICLGRVQGLIETGAMQCDRVRVFVLDEADKVLEKKMKDQVKYAYPYL